MIMMLSFLIGVIVALPHLLLKIINIGIRTQYKISVDTNIIAFSIK